jgi:hypothetical protein
MENKQKKGKAENCDTESAIHKLLTTTAFDKPLKKTQTNKVPKLKDIEIDYDNDTHIDMIKKLVLHIKRLETELNEYKQHAEGTFVTTNEINRYNNDNDKKFDDITTNIDELTSRIDDIS